MPVAWRSPLLPNCRLTFEPAGTLIHIATAVVPTVTVVQALPKSERSELAIELATEAGADDIVVYPDDASIDVITAPEAFQSVKDAMAAAKLVPDHSEITFRADNDVAVDADTAVQVKKLLDMLEDLDDVQEVYTSAVLDE